MNLQDLNNCIQKKSLSGLFILFGAEQSLIDLYIDKIADIYGKPKYSNSVLDIYTSITKNNFIADVNNLYICIDDLEFISKEKYWEKVFNALDNSNKIIILRYNSLKKNIKFYLRNKKYFVEFNKLEKNYLKNYISNLVNLTNNNIDKLLSICNENLGILQNYIKSIKELSNYDRIDNNEAFTLLLESDYNLNSDITFDFCNAVLYGDLIKSIRLLEQAKLQGEISLRIETILYTGFRNMLSIQSLGKNRTQLEKKTNLTQFELNLALSNLGGYNNITLIRNLIICQKVEKMIKSGELSDEIALDYLIISCLK